VVFADGDVAALGSSERRRLEQAVLAVDGIHSLKRIGSDLGAIAALPRRAPLRR
jgi:hypothetical protein